MIKEIEFGLCPEYLPKWGIGEIVREGLQNSGDASIKGFETATRWRRGFLEIITKGVCLDRSILMVGKTTKADDPSQRGIHGEGLTMGALVAAREGRIMEIFNQDEKWIPYIGESSDFPGNQVLKFRVYKNRKFDRHKVKIQITKEEWREIKPRFLRGIPKKEEGDLLTN